ncbi:hypothetical protein OF83DRAFT_1061189 [Amylostereum chailletii]|nr:hypothetical protein OF83DRAFT_1061189 [Amylostereum chailletii]
MNSLSTLPPIQPLAVNPASLSAIPDPARRSSSSHLIQNGQPGPSSEANSAARRAPPAPKRRRTDSADGEPSSASHKRDKKKKASRACALCQKAHLTCDDSRPCQRCTKRGVADQCVEGHRKRAKYLLDEEELGRSPFAPLTFPFLSPSPPPPPHTEVAKRQKKTDNNSVSSSSLPPPPTAVPPLQPTCSPLSPPTFPRYADRYPTPTADPFSPSDPLFNTTFDPAFAFGSEAANLEYSILSAILGNPSPDSHDANSPPSTTPTLTSAQQQQAQEFASAWAPDIFGPPPSAFGAQDATMYSAVDNEDFPGANFLASPAIPAAPNPMAADPAPTLPTSFEPAESQSPARALHPLAPRWPPSTTDSTYVFSPSATGPGGMSSFLNSGGTGGSSYELSGPRTAEEVYATVTKPYDYTEGYHFLMKILPYRFEKNDILRIVRALAIFRPSLIALQMPMTEEDEVFVEKSLQRSIIELNKLISYSGTPTVVWRRTGEICLVGPEFCLLTEWSKEDLLGKRKYIWELFENQSVVEYWENFATHAFENTTQSVYSHCVLLKPDGTPVPATFCFHIRRDIFDLPSLVIGECARVFLSFGVFPRPFSSLSLLSFRACGRACLILRPAVLRPSAPRLCALSRCAHLSSVCGPVTV